MPESEWYDDRNNLADLWRWLEENDEDTDAATFIEKPWKWAPEWEEFILARDYWARQARRELERKWNH